MKINKTGLESLWKDFYINIKEVQENNLFLWVKNRKTKKVKNVFFPLEKCEIKKEEIVFLDILSLEETLKKIFFKKTIIASTGPIVSNKKEKVIVENKDIPFIPSVIPDVSSYDIRKKELEKRICLENISFIVDFENNKIYKKREDILMKIFRGKKEEDLYYMNSKILRPLDNFITIVNLNFESLECINGSSSYFEKNLNLKLRFSEKIKYLNYLQNEDYYKWVGEIKTKEERIYNKPEDIKRYLYGIDENEVFQFKIRGDEESYLGSLNFNLFFILNTDFLEEIFLCGVRIDIERIKFSPKKLVLNSFSSFVDTFLEYVKEDYDYEYSEDTKLDLSIKSDGFFEPYTKKDLNQRSSHFNNIIKRIEDELETKLIPQNLED